MKENRTDNFNLIAGTIVFTVIVIAIFYYFGWKQPTMDKIKQTAIQKTHECDGGDDYGRVDCNKSDMNKIKPIEIKIEERIASDEGQKAFQVINSKEEIINKINEIIDYLESWRKG